jgi:hypothetical protein
VRHHSGDAEKKESERDVVGAPGRKCDAHGDWPDQIQRAKNGRRDPAERHQMHDGKHAIVVEKAGDAAWIERDRCEGQPQRRVRERKVQHRQQSRWEEVNLPGHTALAPFQRPRSLANIRSYLARITSQR